MPETIRTIFLCDGPVHGTVHRLELVGDELFHQTRNTTVNTDVPPLLPDGQYNPEWFTGTHWIFHKYENSGERTTIRGEQAEIFTFKETTEQFDPVQR